MARFFICYGGRFLAVEAVCHTYDKNNDGTLDREEFTDVKQSRLLHTRMRTHHPLTKRGMCSYSPTVASGSPSRTFQIWWTRSIKTVKTQQHEPRPVHQTYIQTTLYRQLWTLGDVTYNHHTGNGIITYDEFLPAMVKILSKNAPPFELDKGKMGVWAAEKGYYNQVHPRTVAVMNAAAACHEFGGDWEPQKTDFFRRPPGAEDDADGLYKISSANAEMYSVKSIKIHIVR